MRNLAYSILFVVIASNAFAQPNLLKVTALPEPGILFALGSGLVGLATVVRRHFDE